MIIIKKSMIIKLINNCIKVKFRMIFLMNKIWFLTSSADQCDKLINHILTNKKIMLKKPIIISTFKTKMNMFLKILILFPKMIYNNNKIWEIFLKIDIKNKIITDLNMKKIMIILINLIIKLLMIMFL
jgi:hypothetical protein